MIVSISGNVGFPITLDPSVWIFDERRMKFDDDFFNERKEVELTEKEPEFTSDERFRREVMEASNDNKPIPRKDAEEILKTTYVMPFQPFYQHLEVKADAKEAIIIQADGHEISISLAQLKESYFLFAVKGKPLTEDGPVHIYFGDGSNKDHPIKSVKKIVIR